MRNKLLLSLLAFLITAMAVTAQAPASFGFRAGVNFQNITGKDRLGNTLKNKLLTGFNAGVNAEVEMGRDLFFQPGLLFSSKGAKSNDGKYKTKLSYIELPLNFLYKPVVGKGKVIAGAGPYLAIAIKGKVETPGGNKEVQFKSKVDALSAQSPIVVYMRGIDFGLNFFAGYELSNNLSLQLNAQLGLTNLSPEYQAVNNDKSNFKNTGFGISVGYRLPKRKTN